MSNVLLNKNYEEYLIANMKRFQGECPARAKSWMITAKSLFPNDFYVQYEAYKMERDLKNTKQASCYFAELIKKFPNESGLLMEMQKVAEALKTKLKTEEATFLKRMFRNLSSDVKYNVLSTVASHCSDPMEHCCVMLLLLQELPTQHFKHGEKVIDTLLTAERLSHCNHPVNPYRNLLVCNATPAILFTPNFKLPPKLLICLLQAAFEFYISYIFTRPEQELENDILKACKDDDDSLSSTKNINNLWKSLFLLIRTVGQQLQWNLVELFSSKISLMLEMNWEKALAVIRNRLFSDSADHSTYENSHVNKEVLFSTSVMFFYALYQFSKVVGPNFFPKSNSGNCHYVLIEGIRGASDGENLESVSKKFKYDKEAKRSEKSSSITVSRDACPEVTENLVQSFVMAVKVWELIHRNYSLSNDFSHLCQVIEMEKWPCFQEFFIDLLIYQGLHKDAITNLSHIQGSTPDEFMKNKSWLQLASCLNHVGEHVRACEYLFDVICSFPLPPSQEGDSCIPLTQQSPQQRSSGHLHFIAYTLDEILHFCIELLISIYKKRIHYTDHEGTVLGHLLVLSQYKWPREEELFLQCVKQIKQKGSFCFGKFFDYVINPGILEEFMFLTTPAGGSITLDLLPTSTVQIGKQRAITRGLNRGAKDDFKEAMRKQMSRCSESLNKLFVTFIRQERHYINMIIA